MPAEYQKLCGAFQLVFVGSNWVFTRVQYGGPCPHPKISENSQFSVVFVGQLSHVGDPCRSKTERAGQWPAA